MRQSTKEDLRYVHVAVVIVAAFMAGYIYRSWREAAGPPVGNSPLERCGQTHFEPDFLGGGLETRPYIVLPASSAKKTGEYL